MTKKTVFKKIKDERGYTRWLNGYYDGKNIEICFPAEYRKTTTDISGWTFGNKQNVTLNNLIKGGE